MESIHDDKKKSHLSSSPSPSANEPSEKCPAMDHRTTLPLRAVVITAHKRSLQKFCFYTCLSFCPRRGYPSMNCKWYPSMPCSRSPGGGVVFQHALQVSRRTHRGEVERSDQEGSPGPDQGKGCIPACTEADPSPRRLLLWVVRIALECILVFKSCLCVSNRFHVYFSFPFALIQKGTKMTVSCWNETSSVYKTLVTNVAFQCTSEEVFLRNIHTFRWIETSLKSF